MCVKEGKSIAREYWRHGANGGLAGWMFKPCNGILVLDDRANVICSKCGDSKPLREAKLSCSSGRHKYAVASCETYAQAISTASSCMDNANGIAFLQNLLVYLK